MRIGIDIDGTITTPYYWLEFFNEKLNQSKTVEDIKHYDHFLDFDMTKEEFYEFRSKYLSEIHELSDTRPKAPEYVNRLFFENEDTFIITAREQELEPLTKRWLLDNAMVCSDLYHLGSTNKQSLAVSLGIDVFLEDRVETALVLAEHGIPTILFNTFYNQSTDHPMIYRVDTWEEAYSTINALKAVEKVSLANAL